MGRPFLDRISQVRDKLCLRARPDGASGDLLAGRRAGKPNEPDEPARINDLAIRPGRFLPCSRSFGPPHPWGSGAKRNPERFGSGMSIGSLQAHTTRVRWPCLLPLACRSAGVRVRSRVLRCSAQRKERSRRGPEVKGVRGPCSFRPAQGADGGGRAAPARRRRHQGDLRPARLSPEPVARWLRDQDLEAPEHRRDAASGVTRRRLRRRRLGRGTRGRPGRAARHGSRSRTPGRRRHARVRREWLGRGAVRDRLGIRAPDPRLARAARVSGDLRRIPTARPRCSRPRMPTASSTTWRPARRCRRTVWSWSTS